MKDPAVPRSSLAYRVVADPRSAAYLALTGMVLTAAGGIVVAADLHRLDWGLVQNVTHTLLFLAVGAGCARAAEGATIGWLLLGCGSAGAASMVLGAWSILALRWQWPGLLASLWVNQWLWVLFVVPLGTLLLALFPDGRPLSPRWRVLVILGAAATLALAAGAALAPGEMFLGPDRIPGATNPIGVAGAGPGVLSAAGAALASVAALASLVSLVLRWRRSSGVARQQLKVFALGAGGAMAMYALPLRGDGVAGQLVFLVAPAIVLAAIGLAVLRYRLYEVDLAISRTVQYAVLTGFVVAVYAALLLGLARAVDTSPSPAALVAVSAVVAVGFEPTRRAIQRTIARLLYGPRDDPVVALARLRSRLDALSDGSDPFPALVDTLAWALRSPYVSIRLMRDGTPQEVARAGSEVAQRLEQPLMREGEQVGLLCIGYRSPREPFGRADRALLDELSDRTAAVVYAVRAAEELAEARRQAAWAGAEERRRLRHDLHDGLGPLLAGAGLAVRGLRQTLSEDDPRRPELDRVGTQLRAAGVEVRRILDALRPSALDDLGLVGALRERLPQGAHGGMQVELGLDDVGALPAAVEQAAYFVVLEAVTNAVRHARARQCVVTLRRTADDLLVQVCDDGCGLPAGYVSGVGLTSMRARTADLGGRFALLTSAAGGTCAEARLPVMGGRQEAACAS